MRKQCKSLKDEKEVGALDKIRKVWKMKEVEKQVKNTVEALDASVKDRWNNEANGREWLYMQEYDPYLLVFYLKKKNNLK